MEDNGEPYDQSESLKNMTFVRFTGVTYDQKY